MSCVNENEQLRTRRIGDLLPKGQALASVPPCCPLESAKSIMLENNYSQLPLISHEGRVEGIITWESIGRSLAGGATCKHVRDCMEPYEEAKVAHFDGDLLDSTKDIAEYGYVLVMGDDGTVKGILTASDIADEFRRLAEGFLAIEEIEGHLERLVDSKFTHDEKKSAGGRCNCGQVTLTLGKYPRLLKEREHWNRVGLDTCKNCFLSYLESVKCIRNRLMHFDARELKPEYLEKLYKFLNLIRDLGGA